MGFPIIESDGGISVIVYTFTGGGKFPIHGAYYVDANNGWIPIHWGSDGTTFAPPHPLNITRAINEGKVKKEEDSY